MANFSGAKQRRMVLAMKAETTAGVDVLGGSYTAADVVQAITVTPDLPQEAQDNLAASGDLGRLPSVMGIGYGTVSFSMWMRGAGAAYSAGTVPEAHKPLLGCALSATLVTTTGAEKYTYAPTSTEATYTIYCVQENGRTAKLVGCLGSVEFVMAAGGVCQANFNFMGLIAGVADVTFVAGTVVNTPAYPVLKSAAFQIGSGNYAPRLANIRVTLNNRLDRILSANAAGGLAGWAVTDRNVRIGIDPEANTVATFDWHTAMQAGTLQDMSFQVGTVQYDRLKFNWLNASNIQILRNGYGSRDGLTTYPTELLGSLVTGNDDFQLVVD